jgi:Delta7-sterol 5-desaturase
MDLTLINWRNILLVNLAIFTFVSLRYVVMAGGHYWIFYRAFKDKFAENKLTPAYPEKKAMLGEIKFGFLNMINFCLVGSAIFFLAVNGKTLIYTDINKYPLWYLPLSALLLFITQDAYFYWVHRLLHVPFFFKRFHEQHHRFINPSPWAAFSVHPAEGFLEVLFRLFIVFIMPLHLSVIALYVFLSFLINVVGHGGFEVFPQINAKLPFLKWTSSPTHHFVHHKNVNYNFSLYFRWWDVMMKTEHKSFHSLFQQKAPAPKPLTYLKLFNYWPPVWLAGFKIYNVNESELSFSVKQGMFNSNYFGTIFGGNLFSVVDLVVVPFYQNVLGRHYSVIVQKSEILFWRPAREKVFGQLSLDAGEALKMLTLATDKEKFFAHNVNVELKDNHGNKIAEVIQTLHVRKLA